MTTATPERILQAAEQEFAEVGFTTATLADIARRAGIRRPSLLYHFGSKEALYAATVERTFSRLGHALSESMQAEGDFSTRLMATVEKYSAFLASEPYVAAIVLREILERDGPGAEILVRQVAPLLRAVERFIVVQGEGRIPRELPVRAALMQFVSDLLLRSAAGPLLRDEFWGQHDYARALARVVFALE